MSEQMLTEEQIITIKKAAIATDPGKPWGDSIAFARAIESAVSASKAAEYAYIRREARNAALEEAAQLCHERMMSMRYGRPVFDDEDEDDSDQWCAHGAEACRNAIRALKDQP